MEKSNRLTDEEILERWYPEHNFKGGRKFCTAAREFLELAGQWPWEWCVHDLNPRRWRPALVQDLRRLAETYKRSGKNLDEAKWPLIRAMKRRKTTDKKNQFLDQRDVNKVINEFKPQHSSPSNGTTEGEHRQSNPVNKTRREPTAVAKPTKSKSTSQPGSSRGSRVTTGLPDRSASRARMATSTHPVETELGPFVSSPMSEEEPEPEPVPETTDRLETTRISEPEPVPQTMGMPETTDLPEIIGMFDTMDMPGSMNMSDSMDMPDTMYLPDITGLAETMYLPEITGLPPTTDMSETTHPADTMPESMDTPQTTAIPEMTHMANTTPESADMPQITATPETTHPAETMPESTNMPEPESLPGTMVMPEADITAEEVPVVEDTFPMEPRAGDSKRGIIWEHVSESKSVVTKNKKRPSSSPTLPPKKRARSSLWDLKDQLQHKPDGHTPDGISATLFEMRYHEITLQKRLALRLEEKAAFQDPTRSYIEQQALSSLESRIQCLRSSIQTLERDRVPIKERIKEWEKLRSVMRYPDTAKMRGLDEVNRQLQKNTTAISNAKKTLQQTIEALDRQKAAGEKLAAAVEDNLNEIGEQVMAWDALMRLVHGFPASVRRVNEVLKLQDRCLEEIASFYGEPEDDEDDDSGIDEPLIKTPELPDLPGWDPLDGSTSLAKAPLHNDI
ncbi:uncharacterized protein FIESC28_05031 [Fusarium coffeatum]|uniref:Uncharacterized protein n=1 Tax=Fusarium coffeatum TaxID=231269 RepID=A0A366RUY1_9HYPO|nr:uncharacterized protein FIESC28_05031 [Fusarium coffeatum]RBR20879.1 hypothetical protein FIESC28_05031 [Fusarium coffeatum]